MIRLVIAYDISDTKRRNKVGELLEGYGVRVNRSVFECVLKNTAIQSRLERELSALLEPDDSLRIYRLCSKDVEASKALTDEPDPFERGAIYFF